MTPLARSLSLTLFATAAVTGCELRADYYASDTEGWGYRVSCTKQECRSVVQSPYAPAVASASCRDGYAPGYALSGRRVAVVCQACVRGTNEATARELPRCRALRCENDGECPPWVGPVRMRCVHGLCQGPSSEPVDEAVAAGLCMAGAGPSGRTSRTEGSRMELARAACANPEAPGTCRAPAGCREL